MLSKSLNPTNQTFVCEKSFFRRGIHEIRINETAKLQQKIRNPKKKQEAKKKNSTN